MKKLTSGKVRDIYDTGDGRLLIAVTDRISAFDVIMNDTIPDKGIILNKLSAFWFELTASIVNNHMISIESKDFPAEFQISEFEGRSMLVRKLKMLPVECIVRGYITGSGWADYMKTGTICGLPLPENLRESDKLPVPLFTPSTKAELGEHDENISFERTCGILGRELAEKVRDVSISVYNACADYAFNKGIIIADTKFEFGLDESGSLVLADEVLTPDSSRFWPASDYEPGRSQASYDKQFLRDWLTENGYKGQCPERLPADVIEKTREKYIEAYARITERSLK